MSLLWPPRCWKVPGRRPNSSSSSLHVLLVASFSRTLPSWRTCSLSAAELSSGPSDPSVGPCLTCPSSFFTVSDAVQGMPEPIPSPQPSRKTPELAELCMKASRARSYPQPEIPAAEEAPVRDQSPTCPNNQHNKAPKGGTSPNWVWWDVQGASGSCFSKPHIAPGWLWPRTP